jgi:glycine cleavage system H protein
MEVRKGLLYSGEHEWVQEVSDTVVRVGITEYAQDQLGDIVFIELPAVNAEVVEGESFAVVESVKAASDVYSPVSGTVTAVNEKLEDSPELVNESPYDDGWMIEVKSNQFDFSNLMTAEEYERYLKEV